MNHTLIQIINYLTLKKIQQIYIYDVVKYLTIFPFKDLKINLVNFLV